MNFDYMDREALIAAVCRLEAEADRQPEPAEQVVARTWSSVPPTHKGFYWFRDVHDSVHLVLIAIAGRNGNLPMYVKDLTGKMPGQHGPRYAKNMSGEWLPVTLPGPENEPGATS